MSRKCSCHLDVVVNVEQGPLKGRTDTNRKGGQFYSFQGIPYAKPPIGDLRFKEPQPPDRWSGTRDATHEGQQCYAEHKNHSSEEGLKIMVVGSEDCLYLNVYTPEIKDKKSSRPVMVFIHGGGYNSGSSSSVFIGPKNLLCEDIVLVTFNYRLGALGFLCIPDASLGVPGNAGMKDMIQALKWTKKNIHQFGGDPNNMTVFGISAGSAAVHYLLLSPLAKGLFQKAILQSGVATNTWASGRKDSYKELVKALGCSETEDKKILKFLQSVPVEKLYEGQCSMGECFTPTTIRAFGPVIEKPSSSSFISESPEKIMKSGRYSDVPLIMGITSAEGILVEVLASKKVPCKIGEENGFLPHFYPIKPAAAKYKEAEAKVKKFYFQNSEPVVGSEPYIQLAGDSLFNREVINVAKSHMKSQKSPIYFYIFSSVTSLNFMRTIAQSKVSGASHADDETYLFSSALVTIEPGSLEEIVVDRMVKMWTSFARTGSPIDIKQDALKGIAWKPATLKDFTYLDIGTELKPGANPLKERMSFWDEVFAFGKA